MHFQVLVEELNDAITRGTAKRRSEILERISDLFVIGSADNSDDQIEVFDDVFVRLVSTLERSARTLAGRLAKEPRAPPRSTESWLPMTKLTSPDRCSKNPSGSTMPRCLRPPKLKSQEHLLANLPAHFAP